MNFVTATSEILYLLPAGKIETERRLKTVICVYENCQEKVPVKYSWSKKKTVYCPEHKAIRIRESMKVCHQLYKTDQQKKDAATLRAIIKKDRFIGGSGTWDIMFRVAT